MRPRDDGFHFSRNNFDLIRLFAALQVAIIHGAEHLRVPLGIGGQILSAFPGVPIFFVTSGYLIAASVERSSPADYFRNRALRIYPALWVCLAVSMLLVVLIGQVSFMTGETLPWLAAQLTIVQFYNPDFLRGFGVGVLNGSLWTIPVEIQFYIALPLLMWGMRRLPTAKSYILLCVGLLAAIAAFATSILTKDGDDGLASKLLAVSLVPYFYMFLIGVLLQQNTGFVRRFLAGRALIWIVIYGLVAFLFSRIGWSVQGNDLNIVSVVLLAMLTLALAYSSPGLAGRLLRGQDISYGVYIYHMVAINVAIELGFLGRIEHLLAVTGLSIVSGLVSWKFVEKPALSLKKKSRAPYDLTTGAASRS